MRTRSVCSLSQLVFLDLTDQLANKGISLYRSLDVSTAAQHALLIVHLPIMAGVSIRARPDELRH